MLALSRQSIPVALDEPKKVLTYTEDTFTDVLKKAKELRNQGIAVEMRKEG